LARLSFPGAEPNNRAPLLERDQGAEITRCISLGFSADEIQYDWFLMVEDTNARDASVDDAIPSFDLRGLEPPQPAVAILTLIDGPDCGDAILVRLEREPIFLYPELLERGWRWELVSSLPGDVNLRLTRNLRKTE